MSERIKYIDIAKGILILIVIFHHVTLQNLSINKDFDIFYHECGFIYGSFFMVAFFVISGYCSDFSGKFSAFFIRNFKGIIIPYLIFGLFKRLEITIFEGSAHCFTDYCSSHFWILFNDYWFLTTLFICKIGLWLFCKLQFNIALKFFILILISFWGCYLGAIEDPHNYFCYKHVLVSLLFVFIGYCARRTRFNIPLSKLAIMFIVLQILRIMLDKPIPMFARWIDIPAKYYIIFLLFALTGTCLIVWVSMLIKENLTLEFFGKNSIIIYCLHLPFITWFNRNISIGNDFLSLVTHCFLCFALVVLLMSPIICIFNTDFFKKILCKK